MDIRSISAHCFLWVTILFLTISISNPTWPNSPVSYYQDIQPILQRSCQGCHQPSQARGDLVLTSYTDFQRGGSEGKAFIAGKPNQSLVLDLISGDPPSMPMDSDPLTQAEIELFRRWIIEGAVNATAEKA